MTHDRKRTQKPHEQAKCWWCDAELVDAEQAEANDGLCVACWEQRQDTPI